MTSNQQSDQQTPKPLRLRAVDEEDLFVVSAMAQDAIVPVRDIGYDEEMLRFAMVVNRFMWERCAPGVLDNSEIEAQQATADANIDDCFYRTLTAIRFEQVSRVEQRGIDPGDGWKMLDLLTLEWVDEHTVLIHFAGDASIRLTMVKTDCHIEDLGEAWPTTCRPTHNLDGSRTVECADEAEAVARTGEPAKVD
ncbi:MAG: DUF2948 family protein [Pseudomonadota bacterium]